MTLKFRLLPTLVGLSVFTVIGSNSVLAKSLHNKESSLYTSYSQTIIAQAVVATVNSGTEQVADGVYMQTSVTVFSDGTISGGTRSWTNNKLQGAHGTVGIILFDRNGTWLHVTAPTQCGVAGRWDSSGPSDRTCPFSVEVPMRYFRRAASIAIVHQNAGGSQLLEWMKSNTDKLLNIAVNLTTPAPLPR
jgi:hypothetical protein